MNKVISKVRVTEVDGLSDALVRLYKADEGVSSDVFLKSVMDEIEKLSVSITTAIKQDKVLSNLEEADGVRDEAVKIFQRCWMATLYSLSRQKRGGAKTQNCF